MEQRGKNYKKLNDDSIMPSGKFKGDRLKYVPNSYLIWIYENNRCSARLREYIKENLID